MANLNVPKNQSLVLARYDYRLIYAKTDRAVFISHLDLMRTMQRVFKRAGIPVWYTQGFNPRLYLMFPLALPLGTSSEVEVMDIALVEDWTDEELRDKINACMPQGLKIMSVGKPLSSHKEIEKAEYNISFCCEPALINGRDSFESFLAQPEIVVKKHSKKKGEVQVDVKPHVKLLSADNENGTTKLCIQLPAGNDFNLNTSVIMDAFAEYCNAQYEVVYTTRTKIIMKNGEIFT